MVRKGLIKGQFGFSFIEISLAAFLLSLSILGSSLLLIKSEALRYESRFRTLGTVIAFSIQERTVARDCKTIGSEFRSEPESANLLNKSEDMNHWNQMVNQLFKGSSIKMDCNDKRCLLLMTPPKNARFLKEKNLQFELMRSQS
jgi:Tfp pilus assembly protein PilV